jgi:Family of unknown function (DUF6627)
LTLRFVKRYKLKQAPACPLAGAWISIQHQQHKEYLMRRLYKLIAQILIVSMVWMPFSIQAGMVGTDQVVASAQDQLNRDKVASFMSRGDVVKQLESFGISASAAKERVDAMTQAEVNKVAGKIDSLPVAGSDTGWWIAGIIIVGLIIWLVWYKK